MQRQKRCPVRRLHLLPYSSIQCSGLASAKHTVKQRSKVSSLKISRTLRQVQVANVACAYIFTTLPYFVSSAIGYTSCVAPLAFLMKVFACITCQGSVIPDCSNSSGVLLPYVLVTFWSDETSWHPMHTCAVLIRRSQTRICEHGVVRNRS